MMHNKEPEWLHNLHTFGEIAIVHDSAKGKIRAKLQDKGLASMFVGYPANHAGEVWQFLNLKSNKLISSRTAKLLHRTYDDYYKHPIIDDLNMEENAEPTLNSIQPDPDKDEEESFQNLVENLPEDNDIDEDLPTATITAKGIRELRKLTIYYNRDPLQ
jgi:hypothetical protein